jgi:hypothetical protein
VALYQIPLNPNSQRSNSSVVVLHQRISLHCACVRRPAGRRAVAEARRAQQYNSEGAEFGCVARARRGSQACAAHPRRHGRLLFGGTAGSSLAAAIRRAHRKVCGRHFAPLPSRVHLGGVSVQARPLSAVQPRPLRFPGALPLSVTRGEPCATPPRPGRLQFLVPVTVCLRVCCGRSVHGLFRRPGPCVSATVDDHRRTGEPLLTGSEGIS